MASFSVTAYTTFLTIEVTGLTSGDSVRIYLRLADGDSAIEDSEFTATDTTLSKLINGLDQGTEYAINVKVNNDWLGAQYFTTQGSQSGGDRPSDWTWNSTIASGAEIKISAVEWNDFCSRINEFREYAGLSSYNFTTVYPDDEISANIVNQARTAISAIIGTETLPSAVKSKDPITASFFLSLSDALNII